MLGIHLDENIAGSGGGGIKKALSEKLRARIDLSVVKDFMACQVMGLDENT